MGQFNPDFYRLYRPFYPVEAFTGLREGLLAQGLSEPFLLCDVGCGTGHSSVSVLRAGIDARIIGIDPDSGMLMHARELSQIQGFGERIEFREGMGEETGLSHFSVDGILVGSAFHWMDPLLARDEFSRILKPCGLIHIFEYQFPKAVHLKELNEWIRRQFNLHWKAPGQVPRGDFSRVTSGFREDPRFKKRAEGRPPMVLVLGADELSGLLLSQSRVLHFESTLQGSEKQDFRSALRTEIRGRLGPEGAAFDFRLAWVSFSKR